MNEKILLDSIFVVNSVSDIVAQGIFYYWLVSGVLSAVSFLIVDKLLPTGYYCHTYSTYITRFIMYFLFGGILLPMILILLPAFFLISLFDLKLQNKKIKG